MADQASGARFRHGQRRSRISQHAAEDRLQRLVISSVDVISHPPLDLGLERRDHALGALRVRRPSGES